MEIFVRETLKGKMRIEAKAALLEFFGFLRFILGLLLSNEFERFAL